MRKYICTDCSFDCKCVLTQPDDIIKPEYCPSNDGNNEYAKWVEIEREEDL